MKIGIEAQRIFRAKKHGMDIYALELIRELQRIDTVNDYFIFVKPGPDRCLTSTDNFRIIEVPGLTYADWEQIGLPIAASRYDLDYLHCTSNTAPLLSGIPLILTVHDIIYLNQSFSGGSLYQNLGHYYRKWVVPKVFKKAHKVLTVSNFEKLHIDEYFNSPDKVQVIYNGVSSKFQKPSAELLESIHKGLNLPDKYLFFLGNTAPKKNMLGVLKAYKIYREESQNPLPLVIAESSKEDLAPMLESIDANDLMKYIHLTGYVNHDWLPGLYAMAEVFLYPSLRESFGIPIIEAMACGTLVITSNTSSMPEVAGGCALICDPSNEHSIAGKMLQATAFNQNDRHELIAAGKEHTARFTWNKTALNQLNVYRGTNVQYLVLA